MLRHKNEHRIELMCRVLRVSVSGYYAWIHRKPANRRRESEKLIREVKEIFDGECGDGGGGVGGDLREDAHRYCIQSWPGMIRFMNSSNSGTVNAISP
jgi:hypothetical protein